LISGNRLALIRDGSTLVNTARGAVVDEDRSWPSYPAASAPPSTFRARAAGSDALLALPNVVLTPHIGSATVETRSR